MIKAKSPIKHLPDGTVTWNVRKSDKYVVTGVTRGGQRFRKIFSAWGAARCINLWNGSRWLLRNGKRHLIQRVVN